MPTLAESVIHPSLLSTQAIILEDITEIEEQMEKQLSRLQELEVLKTEQPGKSSSFSDSEIDHTLTYPALTVFADAFFMLDDPALENIDVMTDATGATEFTRYTNAASTVLTRFTGMTKCVLATQYHHCDELTGKCSSSTGRPTRR